MPTTGVVIAILFFLGSSLFWFGALRAHANLVYSVARSRVIAVSSIVAGLAQIAVAIVQMKAARTPPSFFLMLAGVNLVGGGITFALAARRKHSAASGTESVPTQGQNPGTSSL